MGRKDQQIYKIKDNKYLRIDRDLETYWRFDLDNLMDKINKSIKEPINWRDIAKRGNLPDNWSFYLRDERYVGREITISKMFCIYFAISDLAKERKYKGKIEINDLFEII